MDSERNRKSFRFNVYPRVCSPEVLWGKRRKCPPPINSSYRVRSIFMSRFCSLSVLYLLIEPFSNMVIGQGFRTGNSTILSAFSIFVYHSHLSALLYFLSPEHTRVITQLIPLNQSQESFNLFLQTFKKSTEICIYCLPSFDATKMMISGRGFCGVDD